MPNEPAEISAEHEPDDVAPIDTPIAVPAEASSNIPSTGFHFTPETEDEREAPPVLAPELVDSIAQLRLRRQEEIRTRRVAIVAIVCFLTVVGPLVYLALIGKLTHSLNASSQDPLTLPATTKPSGDNTLQHAILNPTFAIPSAAPPATPRPDDPVANDFKHYFQVELVAVTPLERKTLRDFATATGKNFKSITESDRIMREKVLPGYRAYVAKVVAIHPQTPELVDAHNYLRNAAQARLAGYEKIAQLTGTPADKMLQQGIREDGVVEHTNITQYNDALSVIAAAHGFKEGQLVPVSR